MKTVQTVKILSAKGKSFQLLTGEYVLNFEPGINYIAITHKGAQQKEPCLALRPGGNDPDLRVLDAANIKEVVCRQKEDGIRVEINGTLDWCSYNVSLFLPNSTLGLINSRVEVVTTREVSLTKGLFVEQHPELAYMTGKFNDAYLIMNQLIYYFNGTPKAEAYHTVSLNSGAIPDLNQFIYYGDPKVLNGTLFFYEDFTSLNPYFKVSHTRLRDSVHQPPGCLTTPLIHYMSQPVEFGFAIPANKSPLKKNERLLLANSFLLLSSGTPKIQETVQYCSQFVEDVATIYPWIKKPEPKFVDWPQVTEQGFADLDACEKMVGHSSIAPQTNLSSCKRYAEVFGFERAKMKVANGDALWKGMKMRFPYGDAWQYLFPLAMAGDYAEEFGSNAARKECLDAADEVVKTGHNLDYLFPLRINADFSKPENIHYEYDCTGAYVYLMLLYYHLTGKKEYLDEARTAADRLLKMGFEFPYEFTTTSLAPVALLRLYKLTGDRRYLEGIMIPMAAILRHSWLFNPDYGDYQGRIIFLLTEGMPAVYANGWEEATMIQYLNKFLVEGRDTLPLSVQEMTSELLRWKGVSAADSLAPLLPDPSIIYTGIPREWHNPVNHAWYIPLEGFGYLEWDDSGLHNKPGRVSQGPYCFGVLPEAALLLFHPLNPKVTLYVETPIVLEKSGEGTFTFSTLAGKEPFRANFQGETGSLTGKNIQIIESGKDDAGSKVTFKKDTKDSRLWFSINPRTKYTIKLSNDLL